MGKLVHLAMAAVLLCACHESSPSLPSYALESLEKEGYSWNWGAVEEGTTVVKEFTLRNTRSEEMRVSRVASSCTCTSVTINPEVIAPGGVARLVIEVSTAKKTGPVTARAYVMQGNELLAEVEAKGQVGNDKKTYFLNGKLEIEIGEEQTITLIGSQYGDRSPLLEVFEICGEGLAIDGPTSMRTSSGPARSFTELDFAVKRTGKGNALLRSRGAVDGVPFESVLPVSQRSAGIKPVVVFVGEVRSVDPPRDVLQVECANEPMCPTWIRTRMQEEIMTLAVIPECMPKGAIDQVVDICGIEYRLLGYLW